MDKNKINIGASKGRPIPPRSSLSKLQKREELKILNKRILDLGEEARHGRISWSKYSEESRKLDDLKIIFR